MNGVANLLRIFVYNAAMVSVCVRSTGRLTAVHSSPFARKLYQELRARGVTLETDPASVDTHAQQSICAEILGSGFFDLPNLVTNEIRMMYKSWHDRGYTDSSQSLRSSRSSSDSSSFSYEFESGVSLNEEYSFTCARDDAPNYPYYVSAEFHVGEFDGPYRPGRFLFGNPIPGRRHSDQEMILAETPAIVHKEPAFNVEVHYIQARGDRQPAEENESDPFCKLVSLWKRSPKNQHYRFCVAVSRSTDFKDQVKYPRPAPDTCNLKKISFKTEAGIRAAADRTYHERMTLCYSTNVTGSGDRESFLYISRAYVSNKVYVYSRDPGDDDDEVYLKNLSTNVNIMDETSYKTKKNEESIASELSPL